MLSNVVLTGCRCPTCVYTLHARIRMITYARFRSSNPCPSLVDYENTKRPSYTLHARIRMITYARFRSSNPCPSLVDYGNTKRPSVHCIITLGLGSMIGAAGFPSGKRPKFPTGEV